MKKILSLLVVLGLVLSMAACSSDKKASSDGEAGKEKVTIKFASWTLGTEKENNLDRQMIKAFEKKYPNITVKIDESISTTDWNGTLSAAASAGKMPDVFALPQIPLSLSNDWLMDVTKMTKDDKDFANVPKAVQESEMYNGKVYAIPYAQHFLGYFVNKDLFNAANLDYPEYGMSVDEFTKAVKDVTNVNKGVVGLNQPFSVEDWYPAAVNKDMGWYTLKDGQYSLDSKEFITGINLAKEFATNGYAYETLKDDQKANFKGENPEEVWMNGGIALKFDGTWGTTNLVENASFDWDYIGLPGGTTGLTNDFVGISKTTKHAKEAYLFSKWMSFGKEGFTKRMNIADKEGKALNTLPINADKEILDQYFDMLEVPGIKTAYDNLDNALVEPVKTVPGYVDARWEAPTGVKVGEEPNAKVAVLMDNIVKGDLKIEDYAKQLDQLADQKSKEAKEALKDK
ncbi:ABC transporter substrate-binding protein [Fictibacillus barbaricus]|uniref:Multiple sugar transport system substrate-binding protein n=1 Tax=Fictibacillus barbaricus TaxID=182136 RepID=A0ABU1U182_9BACL|nr:extracellular solute-binding protein [Fictibacillus barbaricus]MDR7073232.1 multiple sugar transport system substrate-binding protein [Fictibacillus barbaricus]